MSISFMFQFSRIHADSFNNIEKSMNKPITKFYNADDISVIVTNYGSLKQDQFLFVRNIIFCEN